MITLNLKMIHSQALLHYVALLFACLCIPMPSIAEDSISKVIVGANQLHVVGGIEKPARISLTVNNTTSNFLVIEEQNINRLQLLVYYSNATCFDLPKIAKQIQEHSSIPRFLNCSHHDEESSGRLIRCEIANDGKELKGSVNVCVASPEHLSRSFKKTLEKIDLAIPTVAILLGSESKDLGQPYIWRNEGYVFQDWQDQFPNKETQPTVKWVERFSNPAPLIYHELAEKKYIENLIILPIWWKVDGGSDEKQLRKLYADYSCGLSKLVLPGKASEIELLSLLAQLPTLRYLHLKSIGQIAFVGRKQAGVGELKVFGVSNRRLARIFRPIGQ